MIDAASVARFHDKIVVINVENKDGTFSTVEGRVLAANEAGIALRNRSNTRIVDLKDIIGEIEEVGRPRRKKVLRRYVREIGPDDSVKQHLADRHGILVSVLNAVDEDTTRELHDGIIHDDLGHRHGDRPQRGNTDVDTAVQSMSELEADDEALE